MCFMMFSISFTLCSLMKTAKTSAIINSIDSSALMKQSSEINQSLDEKICDREWLTKFCSLANKIQFHN